MRRLPHRLYVDVIAAASRLPLPLAYAVARLAGRVRHRALRKSVRVHPAVLRGIRPSSEQLDDWVRRGAELKAGDDLEAYLYPRMNGNTLPRVLRIEGLEHVEAALEQGRGAVLYSVHVWGMYAFFAALGAQGHAPTIIGRGPYSRYSLPRWARAKKNRVRALEQRFGCRFLWMDRDDPFLGVRAVNALRENGVVVSFLDLPQHARTEMPVSLLGKQAPFTFGPVLLAQQAGAPLLDFFVRREPSWSPYVAEIGSPHPASGRLEYTVQECADRLAEHLRRRPFEWMYFAARERSTDFLGDLLISAAS